MWLHNFWLRSVPLSRPKMYGRNCSVPGCTGNADTFYSLPKEPNTRRAWLMFVYEKIPVKFDTQLFICSNHFTKDSFEKLGLYKSGFAKLLLLKRGAVPTVCSSQPQVVSMILSLTVISNANVAVEYCSPRLRTGLHTRTKSSGSNWEWEVDHLVVMVIFQCVKNNNNYRCKSNVHFWCTNIYQTSMFANVKIHNFQKKYLYVLV